MPRGDISFHPIGRDRERLARLMRIFDAGVSDTLRRCIVHALATVESGRPIEGYVPSERDAARQGDEDRAEP